MMAFATAALMWGPIELDDLKFFPPIEREVTLATYRKAMDHVDFMRGRVLSCWPTDQTYCDLWLLEAIWCKDVWDMFDDAVLYSSEANKNDFQAEVSLTKLRILLGPELYYRGYLPPPYPIWMFPKP